MNGFNNNIVVLVVIVVFVVAVNDPGICGYNISGPVSSQLSSIGSNIVDVVDDG